MRDGRKEVGYYGWMGKADGGKNGRDERFQVYLPGILDMFYGGVVLGSALTVTEWKSMCS